MKPLRFLTCVYSDDFADYLFVLLNSIDEVYGSDAQPIIYYDNLSVDIVKEIKRKSPQTKMYYYNLEKHGCNMNIEDDVKGQQQHIALERYFLTVGVDDAIDGLMVVLDCDMLVRKRLDYYIHPVQEDIIFTYKTEPDEQIQWPINAGIQIINNSDRVRKFYSLWQNETNWVIRNDGDPLNLWGGLQQAAFGRIIKTRKKEDYKTGFVRNGCFLRGVPCKYLNETRRTQNFDDVCVIHYKGPWRKVLRERQFDLKIMQTDGGKMYDLWIDHLERWNER